MAERRGNGLQSRVHGFKSRLHLEHHHERAIGAAVARFPDTEEVTGSIPVSPTSITAGQRPFRDFPGWSFKLQAKLATGFGKPAGIFRLTDASWYAVLGERPTDVLRGIGSKTARRLGGLGIFTDLQLSRADAQALAAVLGPATGPWLVRLAQG